MWHLNSELYCDSQKQTFLCCVQISHFECVYICVCLWVCVLEWLEKWLPNVRWAKEKFWVCTGNMFPVNHEIPLQGMHHHENSVLCCNSYWGTSVILCCFHLRWDLDAGTTWLLAKNYLTSTESLMPRGRFSLLVEVFVILTLQKHQSRIEAAKTCFIICYCNHYILFLQGKCTIFPYVSACVKKSCITLSSSVQNEIYSYEAAVAGAEDHKYEN